MCFIWIHLWNMLNFVGCNNSIRQSERFVLSQDFKSTSMKYHWPKDKKDSKIMMMYFSKYHPNHQNWRIKIFLLYLNRLKLTLKFGSTMKLYGLLILKKFMISQVMILISGKLYLIKSDRIERLSIIVRLKSVLVLSLLITDQFSIESTLNMTVGIHKFWAILDKNLVKL